VKGKRRAIVRTSSWGTRGKAEVFGHRGGKHLVSLKMKRGRKGGELRDRPSGKNFLYIDLELWAKKGLKQKKGGGREMTARKRAGKKSECRIK